MTGDAATVRRHAGGEAGFTLIEVLVALVLFSLLVMLLFDNVRFGLQAWQHGSTNAEQFEHSLVTQDLLRRLIGNIYPMYVTESGGQRQIDFDGSKTAVSFLGNAPIVMGGAGRFRFKVLVEQKQSRTDLVLSATPELASPQGSSTTTRTLLLSDIDRAEFSYFDAAATGQSAQWRDSWTQRSTLPGLVRIRIGLHSGDARFWPELLIAPRIAADVGCIYDLMTRRCRGR
jgi:general secretion pathway protein J